VREIRVIPLEGIPEVRPGDDLAALISSAATGVVANDDVVVVAQKAVSKAEGRLQQSSDRVAVALAESARILRRSGDMVISETRHGYVCANAGVDAANIEQGWVCLLPVDPDASARRLRARLGRLTGCDLAVVIADTFGRAWRIGQTNVAIGVAGIDPFLDYRGQLDALGRPLTATQICIADEIAGAAEMVMGKSDGVCAAVVRGAPARPGRGAAASIARAPAQDLFR
jgi:coenzyme F420-0:L-glutamate ligase / coenzyme F420-1:gamma-L-glutamate ligase